MGCFHLPRAWRALLLWLHFHRGKVLQNKSPRRSCFRSTIKHTPRLSPAFSLGRPPTPAPPSGPRAGLTAPYLSPQPTWLPHKELRPSLPTERSSRSKGGSNCFSGTGRGMGMCSDLIVFFHSYCSDHMRAIGSPYNLNFPNPASCRDLSFN